MQESDSTIRSPHFDSQAAEGKWALRWQEAGVYRFSERAQSDLYTIDTPPPTVSGSLHVGHVFSYTQTDAVARFRRMQGRSVFYPMGWDDNGLPTERRVQNYYHVRCDPRLAYQPGLSLHMADDAVRQAPPRVLSRANFIELCSELTRTDEESFKSLWTRLGLSVDWSLEYSTISDHSRRLAQWSFLDLFRKGHIYALESPMLWDVDFRTAVAQAEVEDRPVRGAWHQIAFGTDTGETFSIATTRPELLGACVGVAVHPQDARHRHLIGRRAITPLFFAPVPIFASPLVDAEQGTGIVMVCTFGDSTDVHWWREHQLPLRPVIAPGGELLPIQFGSEEYPSLQADRANRYYEQLAGKGVGAARRAIVELLRDPAAGAGTPAAAPLQADPRPMEHAVKFFEKGDRPLEFITMRQWFVRLLDRKPQLLEAGERIHWHPEHMGQRFRIWTENLNSDWCISRQRYFGVPFPVWYPIDAEGTIDHAHPLLPDESMLPVDPMICAPPGYAESQRGSAGGFAAESDVLDTWFTSSLTPHIAITGRSAQPPESLPLPMDLRPQSHEIIRTWAFYTVVKAQLHHGAIPWREIGISGWVLDPDRKKMSKSKGNVVTPVHLLDQYGVDAVRYWSLSARLGTDTAFDESVLKVGRRLVTKIFNASKYVLLQDAPGGAVQHPLDLSLLGGLRATVAAVTEALSNLDHAGALRTVERFFWDCFTDAYLEMVKNRCQDEADPAGRGSAIAALRLALSVLLRLFAPYLPYVTEEVWSWRFAGEGSSSIHRAPWPSDVDFAQMRLRDGATFESARQFLEAVHRAKTQAGGSVGKHLTLLRVVTNPVTAEVLKSSLADLIHASRARDCALESRETLTENSFEIAEIRFLEAPPQ